MSRPIKFRAWVPQLESYGEVLNIHFSEEGLPEIIEVFINGSNHHLNAFEVILEQYTDLKDKNGKEICEGDIVDKGYHNFGVYDENGAVYIGGLWDSDGWEHEKILGWKAGENSLLDVHEYCKVIGNIHENPELLGGEE